jgi:CYTH domain
MQHHATKPSRRGWKGAFPFLIACLLCSVLQAQETCPVEIKLLLSPPTIKAVVASLSMGKQTASQIYFFDTDDLSLLKQNVIVRVRQGAKNDLTVKVRVPEGKDRIEDSKLSEEFGCETDRTEAGASTSYSVGQDYEPQGVPKDGDDLFRALSPRQRELLKEAQVSIVWSKVRRSPTVRSTSWQTSRQSPFGKLTLEYWEFPQGSLLELSAKSAASEWKSTSADLHGLVQSKRLTLSANQETKTSAVLRGLKPRTSPPE